MRNTVAPERLPGDIGVSSALVMTTVGGFIDAYLFLRHGVFAFAQTGNVVFLAVAVVQGHTWATYLWPLLAYVAGLAAAQVLRAARPTLPRAWILAIMIGQVGVFAALALGAINLGTALGVGQVTFGATLVYLLLSSKSA